MDERTTHSHVTPARRALAIGITIAVSAVFAACVTEAEDADEADAEFRDGCDGDDEYIDENGEEVICIYTEEPGDGGGGDPCWDFPWLCYPPDDGGGDGGGGEAGDGGGGEAGGGGEEPPIEGCTPAGDDCTTAQRCCGSNVCAFGGERDVQWCQPLEASAWEGSCADARPGAAVYFNGSICHHTNAEMATATCLSVEQTSCVIGYNGDCGNGPYTIRIRDLVQAPPGTCKG